MVSGCSFAGGGVGRFESGTHEARYSSSSSSSMSEKLLRMERAGEAMLVFTLTLVFRFKFMFVFAWVFMAGSVHGSRSLQCGFVEGSFQVNNVRQNLCRSGEGSKQSRPEVMYSKQGARRIRQAERRAKVEGRRRTLYRSQLDSQRTLSRVAVAQPAPKRGVGGTVKRLTCFASAPALKGSGTALGPRTCPHARLSQEAHNRCTGAAIPKFHTLMSGFAPWHRCLSLQPKSPRQIPGR